MLLPPLELQSNLKRLRENLLLIRCCQPDSDSTARRTAGVMPLCHTTSEKNIPGVIKSGALLSAEKRGASPRRADERLGGHNEICFYLGSAAFPENEFGFLFSNVLTDSFRGKASATPFDSGGCVSRYPLTPETDRLAHVRAHSMPVPECREYLGDLLASHFEDPQAYLAGRQFACPACRKPLDDPHGMPDYEHGLVRMHEVRIPGQVDLKRPGLIALFAPQGNVPPFLAPLITSGVELVTYDNNGGKDRTKALRQTSVDYILLNILK